MCALLTLLNWRRHRAERMLLYTGLMLMLSCVAIVAAMFRGAEPIWLAAVVSNALLLFNAGLAWQAIRAFLKLKERWGWASLGAALWLGLSCVPGYLDNFSLRLMVFSGTTLAYLLVSGFELLRAQSRCKHSLRPMLGLIGMHAALHLARLIYTPSPESLHDLNAVPLIAWLILEGQLYVIGTVVVSLMMVKDRAQQQLRDAAFLDPLTGIDNRRSFNKRASALLRHAARVEQPVSVLLCDLDHFKKINDQFGHAKGDEALARFAAVLKCTISQQDIYARIGGEEFACVLACDTAQALVLAEKIRMQYRAQLSDTHAQTVSIGVASSDEIGFALPGLMAASDDAMYQAKRGGRDQVRLYVPAKQMPARIGAAQATL